MKFEVIPPPPHLADYVRFFWCSEGSASIGKPFTHRAFAYPCPEFIFCYQGQFNYNLGSQAETKLISGVHGQTQTFSKVAVRGDFGIFGFYLYPHALPQLFGLPAHELTNQSADMKTLSGKEGEMLEENIMLASNSQQRVKIVSHFLESRLKHVRTEYTGILASIKAISNYGHTASVKALANHHFLSVRQFERRFKELSGFSPKLFLRITRFNSVLNKTFQDKPLTQIALEYGYYDQSHFIHDFQQFSGYNPKEYFKAETIAATDRGTIEFEK
jgi:AraC-like DNA-binding protein